MEEKKKIRISVRALVEFLLRSGDLDSRRGGFADREAMQMGSRLHRKIQKSMKGAYQAEVPLRFEKEYEHFILAVEGRADGIFTDKEGTAVDEIKGIFRSLEQLEEPVPLHLAQAKCYAYIYGLERKLEKIGVQMTYCQLETEEIKRFRRVYAMDELDLWFAGLLDSYRKWAEQQRQWEQKRDASMQGLEFPYPYRPGQREMVSAVYRSILRRKQLFVQAPTGVGKTMSTVFPAVRACGEGLGSKIFYLTAKTIARTVAEEAFSVLKSRGLAFRSLTVTAREKMCLLEEPDCSPAACPRARGHYDRINDAVYEMLTEQKDFRREEILEQSGKWQVCPYELELELAAWMDAVICDYNYVFDPDVKLRRFFGEGSPREDYIFLIDEAHNLAERGREMYSAEVCKEDFLEMKKKVRACSKKLERALERCNHQMLLYKRECGTIKRLESAGAFALQAAGLLGELEEFLQEQEDGPLRKDLLEFYFRVRAFAAVYELADDSYIIYGRHTEDGRFLLKLCCVNPAANLQSCLDRGRSAVFFSGTLLPVNYYKKLLSGRGEEDYAVYIPSPFPAENRRLFIGRDVSSRYKRRGPEEYRKIAAYIRTFTEARQGNYMVFFPSYQMMERVEEIYRAEYAGRETECLCQSPSMREDEREQFLEAFREGREKTLVGFCVMGGIFAEGIDLTGEKLIGAAVVGTGLPMVSGERELLRGFYDEKGENGFDYAYRFPGMNKVLQSAGRVIRTTRDRGVILLLDDRFCSREYRGLFPREWADAEVCTLESLAPRLEEFWKEGH